MEVFQTIGAILGIIAFVIIVVAGLVREEEE